MTTDCPNCGEAIVGSVVTEPGIEQYAPCGCRVATDGGSVQDEDDGTGARSVDDTERCPKCGKALKSKEHFPPNQGSNPSDDHVIRYFHVNDKEFCHRVVSTETDESGGER